MQGQEEAPTRSWRDWCAYVIMISPNAAVGLTLAAMPPILPQLAEQLGGPRSAQLITSVAGFGMIVGGMFSGRLLEWAGIRAFVLLSLLLYGLFGSMGLFLSTPLSMGISRFMLGVAGVFFSTAAVALTAATYTGAARSRVIGLQQAMSQVVNVVTVFVVGAIVAVTGWRGAFLVYTGYALILLLLGIIGVRARQLVDESEPLPAGGSAAFLRGFWPICALAVLMGILTVVPMTQLPFVLAEDGQGAPRQVSIVLGFNFAFAAISAMSFSRLKQRFGATPVYFVGLTCGVIGIALMGFSHTLTLACVAAALAGLGTGIYNTYVFDHGVEISPKVYHGRAAGLLFAFIFAGAAINPIVAAPFEHQFGLHNSLIAMAVVAFLCGLPALLDKRRGAPSPGVVAGS